MDTQTILTGGAILGNIYNSMNKGAKRAKKEAHGMEPEGHGNAPATGTHLAGYIEKYVPVNFPDKFTVKQKYTNSCIMRNTNSNAVGPTIVYSVINTNSIFQVLASSSGVLQSLPNSHKQNQHDNWTAQYGYYRVTEMEYKITCTNVSNFTATGAGITPPGAFTNAIELADAVVTLLPTQNITDLNLGYIEEIWEQKQAHNVVLQARSPGATNTIHCFQGTICPEDYDIDPVTTAGDETWTAVGANPSQGRYLGLSVTPLLPYQTTGTLPEVGIAVLWECEYTVQYAGYKPALRQAVS